MEKLPADTQGHSGGVPDGYSCKRIPSTPSTDAGCKPALSALDKCMDDNARQFSACQKGAAIDDAITFLHSCSQT